MGLGAVLAFAGSRIHTPTQESWRGLRVTNERCCARYVQRDYRYPQSVEDDIIEDHGGIYSHYTGLWFDRKWETDIEHIVARSAAHDSGLCREDADTKREFARDLLNLTLASPGLNRDQERQRRGRMAARKEQVLVCGQDREGSPEIRLTIDRREANALEEILSGCESTSMVVYPKAATSTRGSTTTAPPPERPVTSTGCGPFRNCTALREVHPAGVFRGHCAYSSRMDRDKDGWACER